MNRETFMKELEYLLQDISEEEKADALSYYADYLEEAGTDNEEQVLREFGSPERIAAMIRADLADNLKEGGSFTERGFEDERFRDPGYQVVKRGNRSQGGGGPQTEEETYKRNDAKGDGSTESQAGRDNKTAGFWKGKNGEKEINGWKIAFLVLAVLIASPLIIALFGIGFGLFGGLLGLLIGGIAVLAALFLAAALWTAAWIIAGIIVIFAGAAVAMTPFNFLNGIWCMGMGVAFLGIGLISLAVSILFYGKLIPWLIQGSAELTKTLAHHIRRIL